MALEIRKNINQESWDGFLAQFSDFNPFPQSFAWGDILISEGKEVEKIAVFEGEEIVAEAMIVYEKLPFGLKYAFSPKGIVSSKYQVTSSKYMEIVNILAKYLKTKKVVFWRLEPNFDLSLVTCHLLKLKM